MVARIDISINIALILSIVGGIIFIAQKIQKIEDNIIFETTQRADEDKNREDKLLLIHSHLAEDLKQLQSEVERLRTEFSIPREKNILDYLRRNK